MLCDARAIWESRLDTVTCLASLNVEKQDRTNNVPQNPTSGKQMIPGYTEKQQLTQVQVNVVYFYIYAHSFKIWQLYSDFSNKESKHCS